MRQRVGDTDRLARVLAALDEVRCPDVAPVICLLDGPVSRARRGRLGKPPRVWISREAVDAGPDALRGDVAHEYAHLIDPHHLRDAALLVAGWLVLGLLALAAVYFPLLAPSGTPTWVVVAVWAAGWPAFLAAVSWVAFINSRVELRADLTAARLLGSPTPVVVMVERLDGVRAGYSTAHRVQARITHPPPTRRLRALRRLAA